MNAISKLLATDGYIAVNKELIKQLGLHEAIIIGELCTEYNYWQAEGKLKDGMFFSTRENIENNTGLNDHYQRKAFATLQEKGIIIINKKGLPAVNYYKIDFNQLLKLLTSSGASYEELEVKNMEINKNKENKNKENRLFISKDINTQNSPISVSTFVDLYHARCCSYPKILKMTDKRKTAILRLIKKYSYDDIIKALDNLEASDFCKGKNDRGWKADIDFLLREDKFVALLEGKYNSTKKYHNKREIFGESEEVSSEQYSQKELLEIQRMNAERESNGQRTYF